LIVDGKVDDPTVASLGVLNERIVTGLWDISLKKKDEVFVGLIVLFWF